MVRLDQIKQIRKQLGLTQHSFAKKAGVSQSLIAKIESSKIDPTYSKVCQIFDAIDLLQKKEEKTAEEIMSKSVVMVKAETARKEIVDLMQKKAISQLPVIRGNTIIGLITESSLLRLDDANTIEELLEDTPPIITSKTILSAIKSLLQHTSCVIVQDKGAVKGIITKADLLKALV